jgi:hypothetical protein
MAGLNYLRIAQILGGRVSDMPGGVPSFGAIGAVQTAAERFRATRDEAQEDLIRPDQYPLLAKAFESIRNGYELDRVIIDPLLSKQLVRECRSLGVGAPAPAIYKRLQAIRKSSKYGIKFKDTTRDSGIDAEPFLYAAELGYVQLSYRRDASVDDIITDPEIAEMFVDLCKSIAPHGSSMTFKWAVLRLRKMRSFDRRKSERLLSVNTRAIEGRLKLVGTLDRFSSSEIPKGSGIFSLAELNGHTKYLYVGSGDNLRDSVEPFSTAKPLLAMSGRFWSPSVADISLSVGELPRLWKGASPRSWALRLIRDRHPLFNMPVEINKPAGKTLVKQS